jgi:hypothetical protein
MSDMRTANMTLTETDAHDIKAVLVKLSELECDEAVVITGEAKLSTGKVVGIRHSDDHHGAPQFEVTLG